MNKYFILVGAEPKAIKEQHPGGQITASLGIIDFAYKNKINLKVIDSSQSSFPVPSLFMRMKKAWRRILKLVSLLIVGRVSGVIIFCSTGFSFYEKCLMALLCRVFNVQSLLFVRSGHFYNTCRRYRTILFVNKYLLKIPNWIGAQGSKWVDFYLSCGITQDKIILARNWISPDRTIKNESELLFSGSQTKLTFLYIGWLVQEKGVFDILEAIISSETLRNHSFVFAGDGHSREDMEEIVIQEGLDNVKITGWCEQDELESLLAISNIFVLPSYAEGFPNAIVEALCEGLPVITSDVGGIADSVHHGQNGFLIKPGNISQLRFRLEWFVDNPNKVEEFSRNSLSIVKQNHDLFENCNKIFSAFKNKVTFLLPNATQPRFYKRVDEFSKLGAALKIYAFKRKYYDNKNLKYQFESLGKISHGNYYHRIFPLLMAAMKLRREIGRYDVIYVFGLDMLFLSYLIDFLSFRRREIVYELGDIREAMTEKSFKAIMLRFFERKLIKNVFLIVVTSQAFVKEYFKKIQKVKTKHYYVVENKIQKKEALLSLSEPISDKERGSITIGYFGLLRCPRSWEILKKVSENGKGKFKLSVRGIPFGPLESIDGDFQGNGMISYGGAYEAPQDLPKMYNEVDLVWACYPFSSEETGNHIWARTNRFYEACFFKKPMIVQSGGEDAKSVMKLGIGEAFDLSDVDSVVEKILNIKHDDIEIWKYQIENIPERIFHYTDEHEELFNVLF